VVTEQAVLDVRPGQEEEFEVAFTRAKATIASAAGFESLELLHCIENPSRYLLLVRWEHLEDHTKGFRESAAYSEWSRLLHHFYDPHPTVQHFTLVADA
jgi:heme-degrading monooxygenase HmoA